jgi:hypothetical protein
VITFEKLERSFYRLPDSEPQLMRCEDCAEYVSWLTPVQAQALSGLTLRELFRRIERSLIHFTETPPGLVHICPNSLGLNVELAQLKVPTEEGKNE